MKTDFSTADNHASESILVEDKMFLEPDDRASGNKVLMKTQIKDPFIVAKTSEPKVIMKRSP